MIDDSIVRGTTSRKIVRMLRKAGAAEVHMKISSPMLLSPCFYGIDISSEAELLCARCTLDEACRAIGAARSAPGRCHLPAVRSGNLPKTTLKFRGCRTTGPATPKKLPLFETVAVPEGQ